MTMWFSVSEHFRVILYSVIMGAVLGVVYDFIKISRVALGISTYSDVAKKLIGIKLPFIKYKANESKRKNIGVFAIVVLFVGDIIYSLICAGIYSLFLFHAIRGQVRWYFLLASAIGFFVYYFTLSKFNLVIIETVFFGIKVLFLYLKEIVLLPFHLLYLSVLKLVKIIKSAFFIPMYTRAVYKKNVQYTERIMQNLENEIRFQSL